MSKSKGRVKIETSQESPRSYDVGRGEEITVKTRHEKPEVTGGGGGGGGSGDFGCSEAIFALIIVGGLLFYAIKGCIYAVETYVIKRIDPNYVTTFERAEKEEKQKETQKKEDEKRREAQKPENIMKKKMAEAQGYLFGRGINFDPHACHIIDSDIWCCGIIIDSGNKNRLLYIVRSENNGETWEILSHLDRGDDNTSKILFSDKNIGFLSANQGISGSRLYKTEDGGKNWEMILFTKNLGIRTYTIEKIAINENRITVGIFNPGCETSIESYDDGKNWSYIENETAYATTTNNGLTWNIKKGEGWRFGKFNY